MMTKREDLTPAQLRVMEACEARGGGITTATSLPPISDEEADAWVRAIANARQVSFDEIDGTQIDTMEGQSDGKS